ncbi:putative bifunctional diguanylate cyclase/phosphodiesterase [Sphingomonas hankyongi]|uniref:EAL domain-containing protein n=1 Tax=Sphingomonas hankyongi TaxID=2908209 RepID=A0ABT0S115_9SPHN|nr:EAL domain-containing protein [Sphingomonas hankyongi]MCL6729563.1 EAL domain-containing protein [Sphingomonas hankyongi]
MRRSRFVSSVQTAEAAKPSLWEALWFDLRSPETSDDVALSEWRIGGLDHVAFLLGVTHLLVAITSAVLSPSLSYAQSLDNPLIPSVLVVVLDVMAASALLTRDRFNLAPHTIVRCLCLYIALVGLAWTWFGHAVADDRYVTAIAAGPIALCAGIAMGAIVSINSPPLAVVNAIVSAIAAIMLASSPLVPIGVEIIALVLVCYSVANASGFIATGRKRLSLEAHARKAQHFVDEFENSGRGWFWETDSLGTLSYVSRQLADDFQCEPEELLGRKFTDLLSVDKGTDALEEGKTLGFHLSARFPFSDVVVRPASDEDVHWSLSGNPVFDERGRFLGFRGIGTDLTEQRKSEREITRLARFDSLTGLPNRAMMRQTLEEALRNAAHRQKGCAMFLIDLDRFKNVNDTLGHPIGDALLRQVSERLKSVMGNHGQVGRLGGDEFQAVLPGTVDIGLLESLARTLIEQVSRPYMIEGHKVTIGASVGVAIGDPGRACADALVRNADLALYAAKAAGRGKHCFYESSMHSEAAERQLLENDLRQAIERGELSVHYQPIVRTAGEEISGFEALVRWQHPTRGAISPAKFIPLAEEAGLIGSIGEWVLTTALQEAAHWPDHVRIAVNLSPLQFNDPGVTQMVSRHLTETGVRAERLELEITEGVFLAEGDTTDETFAKLKQIGVRLSLDDFGTGYSSLGYLKKAPFDKIKIDQSFVRGASSSTNRNAAIIRAIVTLAETLGMDTCAEGVETHDDLQLIRELGVSMVQGYIFGRPSESETARSLANTVTVEADGYQCIREPRQRLMRRAVAIIDGDRTDLKLRNISSMGALAECDTPVMPGAELTIDIVGVGPVRGVVRWAHTGQFGVQFGERFDLGRLAPKKRNTNDVTMLRPWYVDQREAG